MMATKSHIPKEEEEKMEMMLRKVCPVEVDWLFVSLCFLSLMSLNITLQS